MYQFQATQKGALVQADCPHCWSTVSTHEWADPSFNENREAIESGTAKCPECFRHIGKVVAHTSRTYAARYSAPGYLDCTPWEYGGNLRKLAAEVRHMFKVG